MSCKKDVETLTTLADFEKILKSDRNMDEFAKKVIEVGNLKKEQQLLAGNNALNALPVTLTTQASVKTFSAEEKKIMQSKIKTKADLIDYYTAVGIKNAERSATLVLEMGLAYSKFLKENPTFTNQSLKDRQTAVLSIIQTKFKSVAEHNVRLGGVYGKISVADGGPIPQQVWANAILSCDASFHATFTWIWIGADSAMLVAALTTGGAAIPGIFLAANIASEGALAQQETCYTNAHNAYFLNYHM